AARVARWETCPAAEISSGKSLSPTVHPSFGHSLVGPRSFCTGRIKFRPFPTACIMHAAAGCFDDANDDDDDDISGQRPVRTKKDLRQNSLQDCYPIKVHSIYKTTRKAVKRK
ncbi:hypothetical protein ALC62_11717, partial [Cyphomyrmex costatus]